MFLGLHHFHKRTREPQDLEEAGGLGRYIKIAIFDRLAIAVGIFTSIFNLPQLVQVWFGNNIEGVSFASWLGFTLTSLFWLCYAILHRERILIITFGITLVFQILIVIGITVN